MLPGLRPVVVVEVVLLGLRPVVVVEVVGVVLSSVVEPDEAVAPELSELVPEYK